MGWMVMGRGSPKTPWNASPPPGKCFPEPLPTCLGNISPDAGEIFPRSPISKPIQIVAKPIWFARGSPFTKATEITKTMNWEVLNGVGVDGVGVIFPFFYAFFPFFMHFPPFSSLFSASPKGQGQTTAIYCKNGEFHSDPVCTDPVQNLPNET